MFVLIDDKFVFFGEVVFGDFEVERGWFFFYLVGDVVVRIVVGVELVVEVVGFVDWDII